MSNTALNDFLKQMWKFIGTLIHYFGQGFAKLRMLFESPKLKLEDSDQKPLGRPFSEIPGPKGWPVLGNVLEFNKIGGAERFNLFAEKLHKEYGDIVKVQLGPQTLVFVSNPEQYKEVAKQEGTCPASYKPAQISVFNEKVYKTARGLFFTDGEKWQHGRAMLMKLLLKDTGLMDKIFESYEGVVMQTLKGWLPISKNNGGMIPTIELDCYITFMKGISSLVLGKDYNKFLQEADMSLDDLAKKSIELIGYNEQLNKTSPALAQMLGLKTWKQFEELTLLHLNLGHKVTTVALKAMKSAVNGGTIEEFGIMHRLKHVCNATDEEIKTHCADFLYDITDPVSISFLWAMQALGRNPDVQEKLYKEISRVCQTGEPVTFKDMENMPYLKAVQKEIARIYPTAPFVARALEHEMIIGGYKVPPKTVLTLSTIVSHHNPEYFPNPDKLCPERWFQSDGTDDPIGVANKEAAYHPWGIGKRACPGRLLASAMIRMFIALTVQNFSIESENVEKVMKIILYPDREWKIRLNPRVNHLL